MIIELSKNAKRCIRRAKDIAVSLGHSSLDSGHLLLGILTDAATKAYIVMESIGIQRYDVEKELKSLRPPIGQLIEEPEISEDLKNAIEIASDILKRTNEQEISPELLIVSTLLRGNSPSNKIIKNMEYDPGLIIREMGIPLGENPVF
ncbi:MAG: hypothetical protein K8T10_06530 [Candidatus Eremiobacteraeota bacterium]|nr:hypothetical protein [Candidatus Eremiobacteraeota bacterium]